MDSIEDVLLRIKFGRRFLILKYFSGKSHEQMVGYNCS